VSKLIEMHLPATALLSSASGVAGTGKDAGGSFTIPVLPEEFLRHYDARDCSICGGAQRRFVPVEKLMIFAWQSYEVWRGYCEGCETEKVLLIRKSEAA
jgi:hypothetical protein